MEYITSAPNERVLRITQLAKFPSVALTADVFHFFVKSTSPWSRPHEVTQVTRNFGGCNNGGILVCHPRCESSSPRRRNEPIGVTLQYYSTECLDSLELTTVVRLISAFLVTTFATFYHCFHRNMSGSIYIY